MIRPADAIDLENERQKVAPEKSTPTVLSRKTAAPIVQATVRKMTGVTIIFTG